MKFNEGRVEKVASRIDALEKRIDALADFIKKVRDAVGAQENFATTLDVQALRNELRESRGRLVELINAAEARAGVARAHLDGSAWRSVTNTVDELGRCFNIIRDDLDAVLAVLRPALRLRRRVLGLAGKFFGVRL